MTLSLALYIMPFLFSGIFFFMIRYLDSVLKRNRDELKILFDKLDSVEIEMDGIKHNYLTRFEKVTGLIAESRETFLNKLQKLELILTEVQVVVGDLKKK